MNSFTPFSLQVTIEYKLDHGACIPQRVHTVVISTQHDELVTNEQLRKDLLEKVSLSHTNTHTHTHTYIYINKKI